VRVILGVSPPRKRLPEYAILGWMKENLVRDVALFGSSAIQIQGLLDELF
jgi:hypothetical protein